MRRFFLSIIFTCTFSSPLSFGGDHADTLEAYLREALIANPEHSAQFDRVKASRQIGIQLRHSAGIAYDGSTISKTRVIEATP